MERYRQKRRDYLASERSRYANKSRRTRSGPSRTRIDEERADTDGRIGGRREEHGATSSSSEPIRPPLLSYTRSPSGLAQFLFPSESDDHDGQDATTRARNGATIGLRSYLRAMYVLQRRGEPRCSSHQVRNQHVRTMRMRNGYVVPLRAKQFQHVIRGPMSLARN